MFRLAFRRELLFMFMLFMVTACGGGGGGSNSSEVLSSKTLTGTLIDSEVSGVDYSCRGYSGITSRDGQFNYSRDCGEITFSIGGVVLSKIDAKDVPLDSKLYITDLVGVERTDTTDEKVLKVLRVLQSFNENSDANDGVHISSATREHLESISVDLLEATEEDLQNLATHTQRVLVSEEMAIEHFEETLRSRENLTLNSLVPTFAIAEENLSILENSVEVTTLHARGLHQPMRYSLVTSEDSNLFEVDALTGEVTFKTAPDFEIDKRDYTIEVRATDSRGNEAKKRLNIKLVDVFEPIAKAEIKGNLAGATVQIIELNINRSNILLATETTNSDGSFDAHLNELNDNKLYLFQVTGGVDVFNNQENNGTIRTTILGAFAKSNNFTVSVASELLYTATVRELKYSNVNTFANMLLVSAQAILPNSLKIEELWQFSYSRDAQKLNSERFPNMNERIAALYKNKPNQFASGFSSAIAMYKEGEYERVEALVLSDDKNIAYIATNNINSEDVEKSEDRIKVLDISNKLNPILIDEFRYKWTWGSAQAMVLSEDETKLYVLDSNILSYNLDIYDIDSEHKLSRLGTINISGFLSNYDEIQLYKDGFNRSFIAVSSNRSHTIQLVNVNDPENPKKENSPWTFSDSDYTGDIIFGVCDEETMQCSNVRVNSSYKLATYKDFDKSGKAQNTDLSNDTLYVADGNVTLYDHKNHTETKNYEGSCELSCSTLKGCSISTSTNCNLITNYNYPILDKLTTSGDAQGVVAQEDKDLIYVADGKRGFKILHTKLFAPYTNYVLPSVNSGVSSGTGTSTGVIKNGISGAYLSGGTSTTAVSLTNGELVVANPKILDIKVTINGSIPKTLVDALKYNDVDACADNGDIMSDLSCLEARVGN